jgi:hypothetical protein
MRRLIHPEFLVGRCWWYGITPEPGPGPGPSKRHAHRGEGEKHDVVLTLSPKNKPTSKLEWL